MCVTLYTQVHYKRGTHYLVMTPTVGSLVERKAIKEARADRSQLLKASNTVACNRVGTGVREQGCVRTSEEERASAGEQKRETGRKTLRDGQRWSTRIKESVRVKERERQESCVFHKSLGH